ncbi:MAG: hypothetical protein LQ340_006412 [Diploschistes diacapsis]|nr:MAG: hypothetical protein LQ340_006412 [Diploschistes diacapsis]
MPTGADFLANATPALKIFGGTESGHLYGQRHFDVTATRYCGSAPPILPPPVRPARAPAPPTLDARPPFPPGFGRPETVGRDSSLPAPAAPNVDERTVQPPTPDADDSLLGNPRLAPHLIQGPFPELPPLRGNLPPPRRPTPEPPRPTTPPPRPPVAPRRDGRPPPFIPTYVPPPMPPIFHLDARRRPSASLANRHGIVPSRRHLPDMPRAQAASPGSRHTPPGLPPQRVVGIYRERQRLGYRWVRAVHGRRAADPRAEHRLALAHAQPPPPRLRGRRGPQRRVPGPVPAQGLAAADGRGAPPADGSEREPVRGRHGGQVRAGQEAGGEEVGGEERGHEEEPGEL